MFNSSRSSVQRLEMSDKVTVACKNMCTAASASCMPVPGFPGVLEALFGVHTITGSDAAPVSVSRHREFLVQPKIHESGSKLRYGILGPAFLRG